MNEGFFHRRLVRPLLHLLRQGATPEKLALSVALGIILGVFPMLGATTTLCAVAAFALRLNLPAIQMVNYFVFPLQLALLVPFFRLGEKLFRAPHLALSAAQIHDMMHANMGNAFRSLWATMWHAMVVWCLLAPLCAGALYAVLAPAFRGAGRRISARVSEAAG
jgi:uncharacterized protein (DUF2062 family)